MEHLPAVHTLLAGQRIEGESASLERCAARGSEERGLEGRDAMAAVGGLAEMLLQSRTLSQSANRARY